MPFSDPRTAGDIEEGTVFAPRFGPDGLITAIIQHADTGDILMVAHMNAEALQKSLETGTACFWSRSRQKLWVKGETSGETLRITKLLTDCDQDALVVKVLPQGKHKATCHTGRASCFYREVDGAGGTLKPADVARLFDPKKVYGGRRDP